MLLCLATVGSLFVRGMQSELGLDTGQQVSAGITQ